MRAFLHRLALRLHQRDAHGGRLLSRNRHFHVFQGRARSALRIDKHLRDLETHLARLQLRGERPRVDPLPDGGVRLVLRDDAHNLLRTATLSADEARLLAQHPAGAWALGA